MAERQPATPVLEAPRTHNPSVVPRTRRTFRQRFEDAQDRILEHNLLYPVTQVLTPLYIGASTMYWTRSVLAGVAAAALSYGAPLFGVPAVNALGEGMKENGPRNNELLVPDNFSLNEAVRQDAIRISHGAGAHWPKGATLLINRWRANTDESTEDAIARLQQEKNIATADLNPFLPDIIRIGVETDKQYLYYEGPNQTVDVFRFVIRESTNELFVEMGKRNDNGLLATVGGFRDAVQDPETGKIKRDPQTGKVEVEPTEVAARREWFEEAKETLEGPLTQFYSGKVAASRMDAKRFISTTGFVQVVRADEKQWKKLQHLSHGDDMGKRKLYKVDDNFLARDDFSDSHKSLLMGAVKKVEELEGARVTKNAIVHRLVS